MTERKIGRLALEGKLTTKQKKNSIWNVQEIKEDTGEVQAN